MTDYALRPAAPADLPDIVRLVHALATYEREADAFTATEADFARLMFCPNPLAEAILAEVPGREPAGIALFTTTVNTFKGRTGLFLEDLFVESDLRGAGLGKALMRRLAEVAAERNCNNIEWRVLNWNEPSIAFYERLGAAKISRWHVRRLDGPALTALAKGEPWHG